MIRGSSALAPSVGPGTSVNIGAAGNLWINGGFVPSPNLNIVLASNATSYVFMNTANGLVQMNTTGYPTASLPICTVETSRGFVGKITDTRPDFFVLAGGQATPNFVDAEVPAGPVNSSNVTFVLEKTPNPAASLMLSADGLVMQQGAGKDFTISGNVITFANAPRGGTNLLANYRY